MYVIYDIKDNETCVGTYDTIKDIVDALGIKSNHVSSIISKKSLYKKRYKIERLEVDLDEDEDEATQL
jgi:hypothetical protein